MLNILYIILVCVAASLAVPPNSRFQRLQTLPRPSRLVGFQPSFARQQAVEPVPQTVYGPPPQQPPSDTYGPPTTEQAETTTEVPTTAEPTTTEQSQRLKNKEKFTEQGAYYIYHPSGLLQRVTYGTRDDVKNMAFSAQLRYHTVEPIREPIFTYDPKTLQLRRLQL